MHIVIDGFNLIRQSPDLRSIERRDFQEAQDTLVQWLVAYRRKMNHKVTVVFDGWEHGSLTGSSRPEQGVQVVYSPRGITADERIKGMVAGSPEDMCVVSSDGEIVRFAESRRKTTLPSPAFERKLTSAMGGTTGQAADDDDADYDRPRQGTAKKGPSHRPSKRKRQRKAKYRKL